MQRCSDMAYTCRKLVCKDKTKNISLLNSDCKIDRRVE